MTKAEVYKKVVQIHKKKTGQGLSGIVRAYSTYFDQYIKELVDEGILIEKSDNITIGHPYSKMWYFPKDTYL